MALAYSGDQQVLNAVEGVHGEPWRYVVPEEGTLLWVDCLSVPSTARTRRWPTASWTSSTDPRSPP